MKITGVQRSSGSACSPSGSTLLSLEVRHLGGVLDRAAVGALPSLRGRFSVFAVGMAPDPDAASAVNKHCDAVLAALEPWSSGVRHLNFSERSAHPEAFFPPGTHSRLADVKQRDDAGDVLHSNHPVGSQPRR